MNLTNASSTPFAGCGIVGAMEFYKNALSKVNTAGMIQSLAHRGPDAVNSLTDEPVWLGHRRLSILDLSEKGNQPMTRDHLTIISNGEVYNYRNIRQKLLAKGYFFTSDTDTEVILRAFQQWGIEALNEMNGMFAFAIWDNQKQELFLARDRMGIKPLYYAKVEDLFLFASEVQSLLYSSVINPSINIDELELETFASSFIKYNNENTLIENVKSLLPGHFMKIMANGKIQILKYWDIPKVNDTPLFTDNTDRIQELNEILCSSIQYRLISDVPVSCFLSGGLDSSIIASIAADCLTDSRLTNITITYKECGKDRYTMKEDQDLHFSKLLSAHLGAKSDHRIIETSASEITLEQIDKIIDIAHLIDDSRLLSIYRNYELVKDLGFKVVLNGQGADELMGGYAGLPVFYNNLLNAENENLLAENMLKLSALSNPLIFNRNVQERKKQLKEDLIGFFQNFNAPLDEKIHRYLMKSTLQRILKFEDHLSMLNSVECRLPYLDYRLVEWTFSKPFAIHIDSGLKQGKSLLRKVACNYLPAQLTERPKQTFPVIDPAAGEKILEYIVNENFAEICCNNTICFLYTLNSLDVSRFTFNELWQLIITWRWSEKLNNIATIYRKDK